MIKKKYCYFNLLKNLSAIVGHNEKLVEQEIQKEISILYGSINKKMIRAIKFLFTKQSNEKLLVHK